MGSILGFGGMGMLFVGLIAIVCSIIIGVHLFVTKTKGAVEREKVVRCFKVVLLISVLCLLVGTGMCTLQFVYYPIRW